jgi:hypothetical protein
MSAILLRRPVRSHAARARTLTLGRTALGRSLGTLLAIGILGMTFGFVLGQTGPAANVFLTGLSSLIAGWYSSQVTMAAAKAQRVMANTVVPTSAMHAWRLGWLQAEVILWLVFAGTCSLAIFRHDGFGNSVWLVPGAVLTAQAAGAFAALAGQGRAPRASLAVPWILAILCALYLRSEWKENFAIPEWLDALFLLLGAASLFAVRRILEPLVRLSTRQNLPMSAASRLRTYLQRWTPLSASPRGYWWQPWYGVVSVSLYAIWQGAGGFGTLASLSLPMRLFWLFLLGGICSSTLSVQGLHWRRWLLPGAPLRNRIGTELFRSTAKMYLLVLPPLVVVSAAAAWWLGVSPHTIGIHAVHGLVTIAELAFAIAAADALSAVLKGRMNSMGAWVVATLVLLAGMSLWVAYTFKPWRPDRVADSWPNAGAGYALTLLAVTPALVAAANILWRRRDLHDLIRRNGGAQ